VPPRVRIASVGVGWVARHRHLPVMDQSDQFEVVGVIDRKPGYAVDIFRDIYLSLPNDGAHDARRVITTSLVATFQHWLQHLTSGIPHLRGQLFYGNDEVFARFAAAIGGDQNALAPIGPGSRDGDPEIATFYPSFPQSRKS
jgi:hypothetical protein